MKPPPIGLMFEDKEFLAPLPVDLTTAEIDERFRRGVDLHGLVTQLKSELKSARKDFEARIERAKGECRTLFAAATAGRELRDVKCVERRDHSRGVVEVIRMDTGERISARLMTVSEKQAEEAVVSVSLVRTPRRPVTP